LIDYAKSFLGIPYIFGGNNPIDGIDCSGLCCELLRASGQIGKEDLSAQGIFDLINKQSQTSKIQAGAFAFYGKSITEISHVAFHINKFQVIEAGGGDHTTLTAADASKRNAFVRMRKYNYRSDYLCSISPNYATLGIISNG
jgi:cell wall-associated NlpC family hydrolase